MPGYQIGIILDPKSPLNSRGKKPSKGSKQTGQKTEPKKMVGQIRMRKKPQNLHINPTFGLVKRSLKISLLLTEIKDGRFHTKTQRQNHP